MIARRTLLMGGFGLALGGALSFMGFSDWGEVHRMFTFANLRLLFTFCGALALTAVGFAIVGGKGRGVRTPSTAAR